MTLPTEVQDILSRVSRSRSTPTKLRREAGSLLVLYTTNDPSVMFDHEIADELCRSKGVRYRALLAEWKDRQDRRRSR